MITIQKVTQDHFEEAWPFIEELVKAHEEWTEGEFTVESCFRLMATGKQTIWAAFDDEEVKIVGVVASMIDIDGSGRPFTINLWTQGEQGMKDAWVAPARDRIEQEARDAGHYRVVQIGRKGWARTFMRDYRIKAYVYEKVLT